MKIAPRIVHEKLFGQSPDLDRYDEVPLSYLHQELLHVLDKHGSPQGLLDKSLETAELGYLRSLVSAIRKGVPDKPSNWSMPSGWHQWDGVAWVKIEVDQLPISAVLDFETQRAIGGHWYPRCCAALGLLPDDTLGWFAWKYQVIGSEIRNVDYIPYRKDGLIVAHNANYDTQYLEPFYDFSADLRSFCTQGLARLIYGMSNQQEMAACALRNAKVKPRWAHIGHAKKLREFGLAPLAQRVLGLDLDKSIRDGKPTTEPLEIDEDNPFSDDASEDLPIENLTAIVDAVSEDWLTGFERYLEYCTRDVEVTALLLSGLIRQAKVAGISPYRYTGSMLDSRQLLTIDPDWNDWFQSVDRLYLQTITAIKSDLYKAAEIYALRGKPKDYDDGLEWEPLKSGANKGKPKWLSGYLKDPGIKSTVSAVIGLQINGLPVARYNIGTKRTQWAIAGYEPSSGLAPFISPKTNKPTASFLGTTVEPLWESGVLTSTLNLHSAQSCANWVGIRKNLLKIRPVVHNKHLFTKPQGQLIGTTTGRTSDLWVVLPKPKPDRLGTEVYSKVVAPEGYVLGYADVDQEENVIAALISDAYTGIGLCGSPFSKAILIGDKSDATDSHTITAREVILAAYPTINPKVARQYAKNLNYAANYLAGKAGLLLPLLQAGIPRDIAERIVDMFQLKVRGTRNRQSGLYEGGLASAYNNAVWDYLQSDSDSKTLLFQCGTPLPLRKSALNGEYTTTLANWRIQATGVDIKIALMGIFEYLTRSEGIKVQLALTEHDAMTYYYPEAHAPRCAVLFQIAHAIVKALLWRSCGQNLMPETQLWFESVDCTKRRTSAHGKPVITPSATISDGTDCLLTVNRDYHP